MSSHGHSHSDGSSCQHSHAPQPAEMPISSHSVSLHPPPPSPLPAPPPLARQQGKPPTPSSISPASKPVSLWTQLLGNDAEEEDEEAAALEGVAGHGLEEEEEELSGIQILGQHLAKTKLEAEERDHRYRTQIAQLEREKREQSQILGASQDLVLSLEAKVRELEMQMTKKWQIEYRDNWIAQVETLKQDKKKLKEENAQMKASIARLTTAALEHDDEDQEEQEEEDELFAKNLKELTKTKEENESLTQQVLLLQQQLAQAEKTCLAFKSKLDKELELKWELAKRNHWEEEARSSSVLEALVQVVAPRLE